MGAMAATELMLRDPSLTLSTAQQKHISAVLAAEAAALVQTAETLRQIIKALTNIMLRLLYRSAEVAAATAERAATAATIHLFYQVIPAAEEEAAATACPATAETDTPEATQLFSTAE